MAATQKVYQYVSGQGGPAVVTKVTLSGLTSGELIAIPHGGPSGVAPREVSINVTTRPASGVGICLSFESSNLTANTSSIRLVASDGVSALTDAVVEAIFKFYAVA